MINETADRVESVAPCRHTRLTLIATGTPIRAYECLDCKLVSIVIGQAVPAAVAFHTRETISKTLRAIEASSGY